MRRDNLKKLSFLPLELKDHFVLLSSIFNEVLNSGVPIIDCNRSLIENL